MTFTPDKRILAGVLAVLAISGPLAAAPGEDAIADALVALERKDGVAAEVAGKRALEEGASRRQVAALIGQGEFLQGDLREAREWLAGAEFSVATEGRGLHALARLELAEGNLPAAATAFDQLLARGHETGEVWVDIGRMRYQLGEHQLAQEAAYKAVAVDPQEPRALEFLAQIVRDSQGLEEAIPLFREAIAVAPNDTRLLAQYAATLGDAGRNADSLRIARQLLEKDGNDPFGFYAQSVLAARAGRDDLARSLWWRTGGNYDRTAAGLTLGGILEFRAGNYALAVEYFDDLRRMQPFNHSAAILFARALVANGEANVAVDYLEPLAERADASNYILTLTARAHEQLGQRDLAAQYLDRASAISRNVMLPVPAFLMRDGYGNPMDPGHPSVRLRSMLGEGRYAEARALKDELLEQFPGSADIELLAGDVELLVGNDGAALSHYQSAAQVRRNWPLMRRMVLATVRNGNEAGARAMLTSYLAQNPQEPAAAALLGRMQRDAGNPARAAVLLRYAGSNGAGTTDPVLHAELAELESLIGLPNAALASARLAHGLQRSNRHVVNTFARVIDIAGGDSEVGQALLAKAGGSGSSQLTMR